MTHIEWISPRRGRVGMSDHLARKVSPQEVRILVKLAQHEIVPVAELAKELYRGVKEDCIPLDPGPNLRVRIAAIRKKLGSNAIRNTYGAGYWLNQPTLPRIEP